MDAGARQAKGPDERNLEAPCSELLGALSEKAGDALEHVKYEEYSREDN